MFALPLIPTPLCPTARAEGEGDGPVIDPEVQRVMEDRGEEDHPLILVVELCRKPIDLESLLPSPEEYNECADRWAHCQALIDACANDEDISQEEIDQARSAAEGFDARLRDKQRAAYANFSQDYGDIVDESVPAVLAQLRASLGEGVRQVDPHSQLVALRADAEAFEELRIMPLIRRICYDFPIEPMLDVSRVNIQADRVHNGDGGVGPYTGDSVKVAVVDDGIDYSHPRLPSVDSVNEKDFSTDDCQGPGNRCTRGHGTFVAGVIFTQPDQGDGYVGIAYDANVVNAKVATSWPDTGCPYAGHCPPEQGCSYPLSPGWSRELEAFMWAAVPSVQETRPEADVINYSRGKFFEDDQENDTRVDHVSALNVDWVIHASGASFAHS